MSVMDADDCCSKCFNEPATHSFYALISSYPIFDQALSPDSEDEAGKIYCTSCYLSKFDDLFSILVGKGLWATVIKTFQNDKLLIDWIVKSQYSACPICGDEWDDEPGLNNGQETKKFFQDICRKNGIPNFNLIMICIKCAGKIEVERLKKIKPVKYPLLVSEALFTEAGKSYLEKCLKEGVQ